MRIAFVGKGGSGKTTLSALFSLWAKKQYSVVLAVDADINMHLAILLGFDQEIPATTHISHPEATVNIKAHLRGKNARIKDLSHFRKTTPPTRDSNFIFLHNPADPVLLKYGVRQDNICLLVVGTYDSDDIGASCYHNNLSILENVLSHAIDTEGVIVADMVAGVDAFANTLHAQFDMLVLTVEPTRRGVEVFNQYKLLAEEAGVYENLYVVGNKVRHEGDVDFIKQYIPHDRLIGYVFESAYLRKKDQEGGALNVHLLEENNTKVLAQIFDQLQNAKSQYKKRLEKLYGLHRSYVAADFIRERFGDLTHQIDPLFLEEDIYKKIKS